MRHSLLSRRARRGGFTLIELSVALTIAVVLAGLVLVRLDGWSPRQELAGSARRLGNSLRTWRARAQLEEASYLFEVDPDRGTWRVLGSAGRGGNREGKREAIRKGALGTRRFFEAIHVGDEKMQGVLSLRLDPRGVLPPVVFELGNEAGDRVTVSVAPLLNEVSYGP